MHSSMIPPGMHEDSALSALADDNTEKAKVLAILALAAAVERLAGAQQIIAERE
ncbi:hypothetical protein Ppa06_70040 [Planomonospora parontospora subsp. parontospora]|uniref:Uncharacterized protein n=2 Tax=Planomonospora parontospora TaxID=58119 RepID=A0AA37BML2_9ACTN|nr:hypothetical protein [Planomonospora parontospora]GGK94012.1 hypothetical protein GCM10010126_61740 [Planomonospora parontospora]GII13206.1 hypothetical protein Ppa06_70040 [Planomonospora parontospora subsp. parontospora]